MRTVILMLLLSFTPACVINTGYGDGRVVKIIVEDGFTAAEHQLIRGAAHSWDVLGVRFMMADEPNSNANDAIHIEGSTDNNGDTLGSTWTGLDRITIYTKTIWGWQDPNNTIMFAAVVSHELGHSIGLQHVSNSNARMYHFTSSDNYNLLDAKDADYQEFCRVYPLRSVCVGENNE